MFDEILSMMGRWHLFRLKLHILFVDLCLGFTRSMSAIVSNSKVVQICNIATTCQRDQLKALFAFFGRIDDVQLYPDR